MDEKEPEQMTSAQGDTIMWICVGLALFATIFLPLMVG